MITTRGLCACAFIALAMARLERRILKERFIGVTLVTGLRMSGRGGMPREGQFVDGRLDSAVIQLCRLMRLRIWIGVGSNPNQ
jgi:hypothetical protein